MVVEYESGSVKCASLSRVQCCGVKGFCKNGSFVGLGGVCRGSFAFVSMLL